MEGQIGLLPAFLFIFGAVVLVTLMFGLFVFHCWKDIKVAPKCPFCKRELNISRLKMIFRFINMTEKRFNCPYCAGKLMEYQCKVGSAPFSGGKPKK